MRLVYESPGNIFDIQRNKSISSCAAASGEWCPSLHRHNSLIPETFMLEYKDLYSRKMEAIRSRSNNKNTMTDSIENISRSGQQQVQCRWQALAFAWRLRMQAQVNAVCWCKFSITLSPPSAFLQNDRSHPISLSSESTWGNLWGNNESVALVGIELSPAGGRGMP